jgi:hypothetical protein
MLQGQPYQVQIGVLARAFSTGPPGRSSSLALGSDTQTRRLLPARHLRIARLSILPQALEVGLWSSGEKLVIAPWADIPSPSNSRVHCRSFSGQNQANYGGEAGTDARKVADSQQVVENACLGKRTLDQESFRRRSACIFTNPRVPRLARMVVPSSLAPRSDSALMCSQSEERGRERTPVGVGSHLPDAKSF